MNFKNLLYTKYWLSQPFPAAHNVYWVWVVALLAILALGFAAYVFRLGSKQNSYKKLLGEVGSFGVSLGLSGLLFFAFRQQNVAFLGWRMWFIPWTIIFVVWGAKIVKYAVKRLPEIQHEREIRLQKEKYLP